MRTDHKNMDEEFERVLRKEKVLGRQLKDKPQKEHEQPYWRNSNDHHAS